VRIRPRMRGADRPRLNGFPPPLRAGQSRRRFKPIEEAG